MTTNTPSSHATSPEDTSPTKTVADLIARLGGISPERVLLRPPPGTATEDDVTFIRDRERRLCELIDGTLVEKAPWFPASVVGAAVASELLGFVHPLNLGLVTGASGPMRLFPGHVRIPDGAYVSWDRIPGRRVPEEPIPHFAPDLAVEVWSPGNSAAEMARKWADYFRAGVRLAWHINTESRTAEIYKSPEKPVVLAEGDTLDGGDVLPGFTLSLRDLFARLDRKGD